jgi:hypothetical protein
MLSHLSKGGADPVLVNRVDLHEQQQGNDLQKESERESLLSRLEWSEGLLLGGVTGLGYFCAYLSESGFKAYFGLPPLFADVSLNAVILAASSIVLVLFILFMSSEVSFFRKYGKIVLPVILPFSVGLLIGLRFGFKIHLSWGFLLFIFVLYVLLTALLLHLVSRKKLFFAVLLFIGLVISVSRASGYINAANQTEYLMTTGPNPMVVVDTYKDALIMMPVDLKTRTLRPEYRFVDQKSDPGQSLKLKKVNIGPLKVANEFGTP